MKKTLLQKKMMREMLSLNKTRNQRQEANDEVSLMKKSFKLEVREDKTQTRGNKTQRMK